MTDKTVLVDPSVEYDDNMFFINYDEDTAWIEDIGDASHPQSIPIYIKDIPKLIKALQRVMKGEEDTP